MKVGFVSPEMAPFAKSGEMADVICSLPKFLSPLGMALSVFIPMYRTPEIESASMELVEPVLAVPLGEKKVKSRVHKMALDGCDLYLIDNTRYFWRESIYGTGKGDYLDNDERFVFFNRAVMEFIVKNKLPFDVLHCHNWPAALIPVFLKTHYAQNPLLRRTASVLTLHNAAFQGESPPDTIVVTGLSWRYLKKEYLSPNGKFNFLKAGVMHSDVLNTVSSSYRREIMTEKSPYGLGKILKERKDIFFSIRNGIDTETWNPETDPHIAARYSPSNIENKALCKRDLIEEFRLSIGPKTPLLGIFSYFSSNKGFDLLLDVVSEILAMDTGLVVAGQGDDVYLERMKGYQERYPGRFSVKEEMSPGLMHKIIAGSDLYLMPSLSEPCGLNPLYCFRYGTVPVVRRTGGLAETVVPHTRYSDKGNGFAFTDYSTEAFLGAVKQGLESYGDSRLWRQIMDRGFESQYSWRNAARRYKRLYDKALEIKRGG